MLSINRMYVYCNKAVEGLPSSPLIPENKTKLQIHIVQYMGQILPHQMLRNICLKAVFQYFIWQYKSIWECLFTLRTEKVL